MSSEPNASREAAAAPADSALLEVERIDTYYGKSHILREVSLRVGHGELVALLGLNGAGKTTTLRSILGLTAPRSGSVRYAGRELRGLSAYAIARLGIGYVPEGRRMFGSLTVLENLQLAQRRGGAWTIEKVFGRFPKLVELRARKAGKLSGGEQEMLAIGRALVGNPTLLLVDEPSQGLAPIIVGDVYRTLEELRDGGQSILLVEQNAMLALKVAQRAYVIDDGRIVYDGPSAALATDRRRMRSLMGLESEAEIPAV
ncbi:MAG: ABC transporter ATP-binding protein [Vulcanimicrobiaceae bacterium]